LTGWQDAPLTMANYYTASMLMGLFDRYGTPKKNYYGLLAFGEIARYERRVAASSDAGDVKVLAGVNAGGKGAVLVSAFKSDATSLKLRITGAASATLEVLCINSGLNLEPVGFKMGVDEIVLEKKSGSAVYLLKGFDSVIH
jgi:hypothetical protein